MYVIRNIYLSHLCLEAKATHAVGRYEYTLTFRHHASYIYTRLIVTPQSTFIYLVNKYM